MAQILFRLGRWSFRRKWTVLTSWLLILAGVLTAALTLSRPFTTEFAISGTPAIDAISTLDEKFPGAGDSINAASVNIVFHVPEGQSVADPENMDAIDDVVAYLEDGLGDELTGTERFGNPVEVSPALQETVIETETSMGLPEETARVDAENVAMVSDDERIAYTTFTIDVESAQAVTDEHRQVVNEAMDLGREQGMQVEAGGPGFGDPIVIKTTSEIIGLIFAFIVLIITFGSVAAAVMPVITAVIGVGIGVLLIVTSTQWIELNNITPVLAVMIGLAVGIDYSLFILSRYRDERKRMPAEEAAGMAAGTAGSSVVFAGATVFVALAALAIVNIEFLTWMGLSAAVTVAIAVLVALTLTPALLGIFGNKAFALKAPGMAGNPWRKGGPPRMQGEAMGTKWVKFVHRFPALVVAVVVLGLGAMSIPTLNLEMSLPSDSTSNKDTTQRKSADLMAEGFGDGVNSPFLVIVDAEDANPEAPALTPLMQAQSSMAGDAPDAPTEQEIAATSSFLYTVSKMQSVGGVKHAQLIAASEDGTAAQILVTPFTGPDEQVTVEVAHALRAQGEEVTDATGATIGLTGLTAVQMDITERLGGAMPLYLSIVVGLAIVLLLLVFRSIMVPVVAGLGFLLSVGAAFGLTVLVWQEGLWGLVNTPAPLISFMPIFLIGVTFGLAMDYQVFLVTRMREHYAKSGGRSTPGSKYNAVEESVIVGFSQGARVVTAAAIIMIAVFVAFIDQPLPFIQIFGFALGVGVFFDAFFIRMGLVPATMFLMGRATWWMPKWLDRILPNIDIEGTALEREFEEKQKAQQRPSENAEAREKVMVGSSTAASALPTESSGFDAATSDARYRNRGGVDRAEGHRRARREDDDDGGPSTDEMPAVK